MNNLGKRWTRAGAGGRIAILVPAILLLAACPRNTGSDGGSDAEVIDAAPPTTTHVVLLHTADTIGYVEPCG
jgi:hypothetical protein